MEIATYVSRPSKVEASPPLTPDNRDEVWRWIAGQGGWAKVMPDGYEKGLVVRTVSGLLVDVRYGERVLRNPSHHEPDFWPVAPEVFAAKYEEQV